MLDKILVPLDGSKLAECSLPYIEELAKNRNTKDVILFRVYEQPVISSDYPPNMPETWEQHVDQIVKGTKQQASLYLDEISKKLKAAGVNARIESCLGKAAEEIVNYAEKNQVNLIVIGSHGRSGVSRWALGSVAEKVFRSTSIPVLMIKAIGNPQV
jgi:nucleotide-binding universal stress UspA family protein